MQNIEELKQQIVAVLQAEQLPQAEQDTLMAKVTDALLERATLTLMSKLPPKALAELNSNEEITKDPTEMLAYFEKHIPNVDEIMQKAFKEGLQTYQQSLATESEK